MRMIDALFPNGIPTGTSCDIIAAYIDHSDNANSFTQAVARFPNAIHLRISVHGNVAEILDCETSTAIRPADCPPWVVRCRAAGIDPTVYCNQMSGWPAVRAAFKAAGVAEPHYWVANYDGNPTVPAGAVAKQWTDLDQFGNNTYDTSSTVAGWPSGHAAAGTGTPITSAGSTEEDDMSAEAEAQIGALYSLLMPLEQGSAVNAPNLVSTMFKNFTQVNERINHEFDEWWPALFTLLAAKPAADGSVNTAAILTAIQQLPAATVAAIKAAL